MDLWSVIVYGRTKEADYRFLAIPDDFGIEEQNWARKYIHGTTVYAEKLRGNPRWSLFKNHKHCIFGVTCMVRELIASEPEYKYLAKDAAGRSLHIFVGYVARINKYSFNSLKILPGLEDLEFFKSEYLLTSLKNLWYLKDYQFTKGKIHAYPYELVLNYSNVTEFRDYINVLNKSINPNFIPCSEGENKAFICPDEPEYRHNLWESCCKFFDYPYKYITLSLCLGIPRKQDVLQGPFLNATTSDATQLIKLVKPNSKVINDSLIITTKADIKDASNSTKYVHNNSIYTFAKRLSDSISWKHITWMLLISAFLFFMLLFIFKIYILAIAIVISILIGFYLGIVFENSTTKN